MRVLSLLFVFTGFAFSQATKSFTVTEVSRIFDQEGHLKSESRFLFATNKDGSVVSVDLNVDAKGRRQIVDNNRHREILVDPQSESASVMQRTISAKHAQGRCDEMFAAPTLGCYVLRSVTDPGGRQRESLTTESLTLGEPDPSLYEVPKGYSVKAIAWR